MEGAEYRREVLHSNEQCSLMDRTFQYQSNSGGAFGMRRPKRVTL